MLTLEYKEDGADGQPYVHCPIILLYGMIK